MADKKTIDDPMDLELMTSLKHWGEPPKGDETIKMGQQVAVDCGWGRLIFGQTYPDPACLAGEICREAPGKRDIAIYIRDPHVVLSYAPQQLFLDPSYTYRLDLAKYKNPAEEVNADLVIRPWQATDDVGHLDRIYQAWGMLPSGKKFYLAAENRQELVVLVAEDVRQKMIVGVVTGVDHRQAFRDPDNGSSLWALAVDKQCQLAQVGESLVRGLIDYYQGAGRSFLDLSVLHTNTGAIALYEKLGFVPVPVYVIKKKNSINEALFIGPKQDEDLNVYARIIVKEARRRGIGVEILDGPNGYFRLSLGGRSIVCRESLSELTSAIALSRCDDKQVTRKMLSAAGLRVPAQSIASGKAIGSFLEAFPRVVVKPAHGEQGKGISVDLSEVSEVLEAIGRARQHCDKVLLEEYIEGEDLRIIVINYQVVAAAVRRPASVCGNGTHSIRQLIRIQTRRRKAATQGESLIPLDDETLRIIGKQGYELEDVLEAGKELLLRKTANLHTGGTIHDVTERLHPTLAEKAVIAARTLEIPVVGLDFIVPRVDGEAYAVIEANERPGLANHEPQPAAECFVDLLFPDTRYLVESVAATED